jgi:large subunit ribosomal protein L4
MVSLPVFDRAGKEVGKYEIDPAAIAPKINKQLLHDVVVMYQASRRMGTHKTKTRAEVRGTTKKMYRQKGTGNARAGSKQAPHRRGGGHVFALRNRDYSYRLPKKAIQAATRMAIASKLNSEDVIVLDELSLTAPKTRDVAAIIKALNLQDMTLLLATATLDPVVYKSARNIDKLCISPVSDLNALSVLSPKKLIVTRAALDAIKERAALVPASKGFSGKGSGQAAKEKSK